MRQLTSLDAQFLALESRRQTGHVAGLMIYDTSTARDGLLFVRGDQAAHLEEALVELEKAAV